MQVRSERDWLVPAACVVAAEYLIALAIGAKVGFHYTIPFGDFLIATLVSVAAAMIGLLLFRLAMLAWVKDPSPTRRIIADAARNRVRLSCFALGFVLVGLQMGALNWLKIMLPIATPFWADSGLADLDRAIFGTDPWRLSHAAFGWAAGIIDRVYISWAPIKFIALVAILCLPASSAKSRAMLSYFLIVSITAIGQYSLSSAGPIFTTRFADIPLQPWVESARSYLLADFYRGGGHIGTGISAMPSLHVAIALWTALVMRSYVPRLQVVGWAYFVLITIGSVHLGWHYAVDSLAGIAGTVICWKLAVFVRPSQRTIWRRPVAVSQ